MCRQLTSREGKTLEKYKTELRLNATNAEAIFKSKLEELGIKYMFQKGFITEKSFYIVDFYLPKPYRICIEIDGEYHNQPRQKYYDKKREQYLIKDRGFRIIRLSNNRAIQITKEEITKLLEHVKNNSRYL